MKQNCLLRGLGTPNLSKILISWQQSPGNYWAMVGHSLANQLALLLVTVSILYPLYMHACECD